MTGNGIYCSLGLPEPLLPTLGSEPLLRVLGMARSAARVFSFAFAHRCASTGTKSRMCAEEN